MSGIELMLVIGMLVLVVLLVGQVLRIVGNSGRHGGLYRSWQMLRYENEVEFEQTLLALHHRLSGAQVLDQRGEPVVVP